MSGWICVEVASFGSSSVTFTLRYCVRSLPVLADRLTRPAGKTKKAAGLARQPARAPHSPGLAVAGKKKETPPPADGAEPDKSANRHDDELGRQLAFGGSRFALFAVPAPGLR